VDSSPESELEEPNAQFWRIHRGMQNSEVKALSRFHSHGNMIPSQDIMYRARD
jgi:hypothetical protein